MIIPTYLLPDLVIWSCRYREHAFQEVWVRQAVQGVLNMGLCGLSGQRWHDGSKGSVAASPAAPRILDASPSGRIELQLPSERGPGAGGHALWRCVQPLRLVGSGAR